MSISALKPPAQRLNYFRALGVQARVIGAVLMRELHTRYGRENIGYLWLVGEPLMLGSVIGLIHAGQKVHHDDFDPVTLAVIGYTLFIMFRGIVARSDGALAGNVPLLYHRMVTVIDIVIARAVLEAAGTFLSFFILLSLLIGIGYATLPSRPLMLMLGVGYVFWISLAVSMIVVGGTYERRVLERLVHPFNYFMMPLSGAFYRVGWLPDPFRHYLLFNPLAQVFELIRYGQFDAATLEYVNFYYITGVSLVLTVVGLVCVKSVKNRIHLT